MLIVLTLKDSLKLNFGLFSALGFHPLRQGCIALSNPLFIDFNHDWALFRSPDTKAKSIGWVSLLQILQLSVANLQWLWVRWMAFDTL